MSFSDTLDFGNSTFINLGKLENNQNQDEDNKNLQHENYLQQIDISDANFITNINFSEVDHQNNKSYLNNKEIEISPATATENESFILIEDIEQHIQNYVDLNKVKNEIKIISQNEKHTENKLYRDSTQTINNNLTFSNKNSIKKLKESTESFNLNENSKTCDKSVININNSINIISNIENQTDLSKWNLSDIILQEYKRKGITKMFHWQLECLSIPKVLFEHRNLIYSAPTSAGKTLVSELLIIKTLIERNKKAIIILPFISVVREKLNYLQDILSSSGYKIEGYYGGYNSSNGFDNIDLAICTIEKANSIINKLLENNKLDNLGIVVIDEIHLISDKSRGYILEILLSKILYLSRIKGINIQIIAMSATLANASLLQKWLHAELYLTDYRPVELKEMIKISDNIYDNKFNLIKTFKPTIELPNDQDHVAQICIETILEGSSILIFCPSKDWCESLSLHISTSIHYCMKNNSEFGEKIRKYLIKENLTKVKEKFKELSSGFDNILEKTLSFASAFHHAGLTFEERELIEFYFKTGDIKVIVATSTLSSGVNLPARRVIIRSPLFGGKKLCSLTYRQMIGRAGRTGQDTIGESILICNPQNSKLGKDLFNSELDPISSCLHFDNFTHLKRAFLEAISSNIVSSLIELIEFSKSTLFYTENLENDDSKVLELISDNINFLKEYEFIRIGKDGNDTDYYFPSRLGCACLASSIPPKDALILLSELQKARRCFVLESELHAIYLVTPYSVCYQLADLDWLFYLDLWEKLSGSLKRVGDLIGIKESFLVRATRGNSKLDYHSLQIHKRFYTALALQDLVNEVPISIVAQKYKCNRGLIQSLQQISSTFAGIVTQFCYALKWDVLAVIISEFKERLYFGVQRDLIDLTRLPELNSHRARALYDAGIENLHDLARARIITIEKILLRCIAFESEKDYNNEENEYVRNERKEFRNFYMTGHPNINVTEAAEMLISNARNILKNEMGVEHMKWAENEDIASKSESINEKNEIKCDTQPNDILNNTVNIHSHIVNPENSNIEIFSISTTQKLITKNVEKMEINNNNENIENCNEMSRLEVSQDNESSIIEFIEIEPLTSNNNTADIEEISRDISLMEISENELNKNFNISDIDMDQNISLENQSEKIGNKVNASSNLNTNKNYNLKSNSNLETLWNESLMNVDSNILHYLDDNKVPKLFDTRNKDLSAKKQNSLLTKSSFEISNISEMSVMNCPNLLNESQLPKNESNVNYSMNNIHIIDICGNIELFNKAMDEILKCDMLNLSFALEKINFSNKNNMIGGNLLVNQPNSENKKLFECINEFYIDGISIVFETNIIFYLNLQITPKVEQNLKLDFLEKIFNTNISLNILDTKEQLKVLYFLFSTPIVINSTIQDPKVAHWLLDPDEQINFLALTKKYAPQCQSLLKILGEPKGYLSIGLDYNNSFPGYIRSAIEACITNHIFKTQLENLFTIDNGQLGKFFYDLEMPMQIILSRMEFIGFSVKQNFLNDLISNINEILKLIQRRIYELHGKQFNIESATEVAKVLGLHKKKNGKYSTSRQILEKIDSPISDLIINYRKLKYILSNNIAPLTKSIRNNRIYANSNTFTSTGRISMYEPNLQNVARNFEIYIDTNTTKIVACRNAFNAPDNYSLISADFCQLEIRVLTHLSQDPILISVVKKNTDLFTSIAAKWNKISESEVNSKLRESTKQVCYGIIYGMGTKALSETLKCSETEALSICEQFYRSYSGIRDYIGKIKKFAKLNGYVETITGRRRYLPFINSDDGILRAKAERQAINTIIQGSAADIVKSSILRMDKNILKYHSKLFNDNSSPRFVLHVHDELVYEIPINKINNFAKIFKLTLENTVKLTIPLKVKLKVGKSWGELKDYST